MRGRTPGAGLFHAAKAWRSVICRTLLALRPGLAASALLTYAILAMPPAQASVGPGNAATPTTIRIAAAGWGSTRVEDLQIVLDAVAAEFGLHFPGRSIGLVQVVPGTGPLVLFQRSPEGAYIVELSARNERWHQFIYQFSHELCHIYSNFDNKDLAALQRGNQWFEESVCETAALYTLRRLAARWGSTPPQARWSVHATALHNYAEYFLNEPHRRLPAARPFTTWFQENQAALLSNPYFRDKNEVVANLLLPLFESEPRYWGAIAYLNYEKDHARKGFADFLRAWHDAAPQEYREVVRKIMGLFEATATYTAELPADVLSAH